ncbi:MAG TPA: type II secretion system F family protein, partial [Candidatus Dormibacteraeota bacterium]|nr:type II secretion system F family protein [Candidatus Dormibacteraeota bacterium]
MTIEVAVRACIAGAGVAALAVAVASVLGARSAGSVAEAGGIGAGRRAILAVLDVLAPLARRSHLLRRDATRTTVHRRVRLARSTSRLARLVDASQERRDASRADRRFESGGGPADGLPDTLAALRALCLLVCGTCAVAIALTTGPVTGGAAVALALGATRAPDVVLAMDAAGAARRVEAAMPAALELLAACCRGGLALEAALAVTASHAPEPLRGVIDRARRRQRAGQSPSAALRLEAEATGLDELAAIGR